MVLIAAGLTLLGLSSVGILTCAILEWKLKEPLYRILAMKVLPWILAVGGILYGVGMVRA